MTTKQRDMLDDIEAEVRYTQHLIGREALDARVMQAMADVPRASFVPHNLRGMAFDNGPLPIGHGQTISQPYIVALMTDLLQPGASDTLLEIGTGSGYQAAILSRLCARVYSVERVSELGEAAAERLHSLGYDNIEIRVGDGYAGWPEHAPYDGIIVTAAAPFVPPALVEQLRPGGRLVIPVGESYGHQELMLIEKRADGTIRERAVLGVAFVPLVGAERASS
ncbi:MAG: protein-L-isoaspartate(D-aspartate) O-methyltransferase [Gammaproteobacteria bacterium]|jgi:protein-L-isoaspartate(D-aspartate) O-methyltransferase